MAELNGCIQLLILLLFTILTCWWGQPGHVAIGSASADLGNPLAGLLQGKGALCAIGCCLAVALLLKLGRGSPPLGLSEAQAERGLCPPPCFPSSASQPIKHRGASGQVDLQVVCHAEAISPAWVTHTRHCFSCKY